MKRPFVPQFGQLMSVEAVLGQVPVLGLVGFLEVIGPEAVVAVEAFHQRVVKRVDVAGRPPDIASRGSPPKSRPTMSSREVTMACHHARLMFSFSSTPSGP